MRIYNFSIIAGLVIVLFSACNNTSKQAALIPKNANAVVGIHAKELSKKIAWNVLVGSELFDEMKSELPDTAAVNGLGDAGIDVLNTIYAYTQNDERFSGGMKLTAIIPISDVKKWEAYILKNFPGTAMKNVRNRKEANLGDNMYAGWTNDIAIVMNTISEYAPNENGEAASTTVAKAEDILPQEMDAAFNLDKSNSIVNDKRFTALEEAGHDVTLWVNYEGVMNKMNKEMAAVQGLNINDKLWKNSAMATGIDFEKGKIAATMKYYVADELQQVYKEYGSPAADKEMIAMLPKQNLSLIAALNFSPKALKATLDKTGLLGLMSLGLANSGLSNDDIFDAFSGDMALSVNDFMVKKKTVQTEGMEPFTNPNPTANYLYTAKIGDITKLEKIIKFATDNAMLTPLETNAWIIGFGDTTYIVKNEKYLAVSNKLADAKSFLSGAFKTQTIAAPIKEGVMGKPFGVFADFQTMLANIEYTAQEQKDSLMTMELKNTAQNIVINGGEYKEGYFGYNIGFNFVNKNENSLIILMNLAARMQKIDGDDEATNPAVPTAMASDTLHTNN